MGISGHPRVYTALRLSLMCPSYGICPSGSVNHRPSKTRPPTRHCLKVPPQYLSCTVIKPRSLSVLPAGCHGEKLSVDGSRQGEEWMLVSSILIIHYVLGRGGGFVGCFVFHTFHSLHVTKSICLSHTNIEGSDISLWHIEKQTLILQSSQRHTELRSPITKSTTPWEKEL